MDEAVAIKKTSLNCVHAPRDQLTDALVTLGEKRLWGCGAGKQDRKIEYVKGQSQLWLCPFYLSGPYFPGSDFLAA
jgi:hypothetical protein